MPLPILMAGLGPELQTSLQKELAEACHDLRLQPVWKRQPADLLPRFARYYGHLTQLNRRTRRALQRQWKRSLSALALLLALGQAPALAANFNIPCPGGVGDNTALIQAINNANNEVANPGPDSITLVANCTHTLTAADNSTYGPTGLPAVSSAITIEGNGSTIRRDSSAPGFRLIRVISTGDLTLNETTVSGGVTAPNTNYASGGGIANYDGSLTLTNSTVAGNTGTTGGGVFNSGTLTLTNSTVSGNNARRHGGGVYNISGTSTFTNSTVSGNSAGIGGGGVRNYGTGTVTLTNSTVSGNSAVNVGGIGHYGALLTLTNSTVSNNISGSYGAGGAGGNGRIAILTNSTVSGNTAGVDGGGITSCVGCTLTLTNSTVSGNSAARHGGGV